MRFSNVLCLTGTLMLAFATSGQAATLSINIDNLATTDGAVGCALFNAPEGFPNDYIAVPNQLVQPQENGTAYCEFSNLSPGTYAVSVMHDLNSNLTLDTNFFGIPREAWGVSNNVRPALSAPSFNSARFELNGDKTINITLDK
ncbi:MAG: hypothetical protein HLUCCA11_18175 [Phormidesmis priestleyi Ana]|uniref:DUF2141 domain-containing protein n=1 Tax=Phormidesmis priestleyi Ana TaxID=1666911 RepID=A0A0P7ZG23_9CYAN|nr:MAG: hypothetical protein HLUCCA11_18175 [Phormidesmis priestleyi Ana]